MATIKIVDSAAAGGGTGSDLNPYTFAEMITLINAGAAGAFANFEFWLNDGVYTRSAAATLTNGGSSSGRCVIKSRNPRQAILRAAVGAATTRFAFFVLGATSNASYLTWDNLSFDGNFAAGGTANLGVQTVAGANLHHHTVQDCRFNGLQGNPIEFSSCDYSVILRNQMFANGQRQPGSDQPNSTSSGVTLNVKSSPYSFDAYTGFHNIVAYNIIAGQYGRLTDGNGIIIDNGGGGTELVLQNTLIIRNICYGNGGRGIHNLRCDAPTGHWFVNNLCFKNSIDKTNTFNINGFGTEMDVHLGGPTWMVNNICVPWTGTGNFGTTAFRDDDGGLASVYHLSNNKRVTGGRNSSPLTAVAGEIDNITISQAGFLNAPTYNPDTIGDPYLVPDPATLGSAFDLSPTSVLRDAGVDPRLVSGMNANMITDIGPYLATDLANRTAPR